MVSINSISSSSKFIDSSVILSKSSFYGYLTSSSIIIKSLKAKSVTGSYTF